MLSTSLNIEFIELDVATAGVVIAIKSFLLATNFPCFSLIETLLLVTKSENLGSSQALP